MKSNPFLSVCALLVMLVATGCAAPEPAPEPTPEPATPEVIRTADPIARGLSLDDFPRIKELGDGVYSYEELRGRGGEEPFTTVSMFVVTDEGVLVADGQGNVEATQTMVDMIAAMTDQPITHVVICSDHGDHTGGNTAFPSDATFIASSTSQATMERSANNPNRREGSPPVIVPQETVDDLMTLTLGGKEIQIMFLGRAHTGGDLSVYVPADKVLFMSEAFLNRVFPAMRSAYPSEWSEVTNKALAMDVDVYVPGHGFVEEAEVSREELETYRDALDTVIAEATRLHGMGLAAEEALEQANWGDLAEWRLSASQGPTALRKVYQELNGELDD